MWLRPSLQPAGLRPGPWPKSDGRTSALSFRVQALLGVPRASGPESRAEAAGKPSPRAGKGLRLSVLPDRFASHRRGRLREDRAGTMATGGPGPRSPGQPAAQAGGDRARGQAWAWLCGDRPCRALSDHLGPSPARPAAQPPGSGPPRVTLTRVPPSTARPAVSGAVTDPRVPNQAGGQDGACALSAGPQVAQGGPGPQRSSRTLSGPPAPQGAPTSRTTRGATVAPSLLTGHSGPPVQFPRPLSGQQPAPLCVPDTKPPASSARLSSRLRPEVPARCPQPRPLPGTVN